MAIRPRSALRGLGTRVDVPVGRCAPLMLRDGWCEEHGGSGGAWLRTLAFVASRRGRGASPAATRARADQRSTSHSPLCGWTTERFPQATDRGAKARVRPGQWAAARASHPKVASPPAAKIARSGSAGYR